MSSRGDRLTLKLVPIGVQLAAHLRDPAWGYLQALGHFLLSGLERQQFGDPRCVVSSRTQIGRRITEVDRHILFLARAHASMKGSLVVDREQAWWKGFVEAHLDSSATYRLLKGTQVLACAV